MARLQVAYAFEGCPHYASDPGRRPAAAIRAGWVRFVQQQQPAPAGKQHNHHRAAGNDARPLLSGSLPLSRRWHPHVERRAIEQPALELWDRDRSGRHSAVLGRPPKAASRQTALGKGVISRSPSSWRIKTNGGTRLGGAGSLVASDICKKTPTRDDVGI
jgi:hypothetical protein